MCVCVLLFMYISIHTHISNVVIYEKKQKNNLGYYRLNWSNLFLPSLLGWDRSTGRPNLQIAIKPPSTALENTCQSPSNRKKTLPNIRTCGGFGRRMQQSDLSHIAWSRCSTSVGQVWHRPWLPGILSGILPGIWCFDPFMRIFGTEKHLQILQRAVQGMPHIGIASKRFKTQKVWLEKNGAKSFRNKQLNTDFRRKILVVLLAFLPNPPGSILNQKS